MCRRCCNRFGPRSGQPLVASNGDMQYNLIRGVNTVCDASGAKLGPRAVDAVALKDRSDWVHTVRLSDESGVVSSSVIKHATFSLSVAATRRMQRGARDLSREADAATRSTERG